MAYKAWMTKYQNARSLGLIGPYRNMMSGFAAFAGSSMTFSGLGTTVLETGERVIAFTEIPLSFYTERVTAPVTISGTITFNLWINRAATALGRLRVRLWKLSAGGTNIETPIGTFDPSVDLASGTAAVNFTGTPTAFTLGVDERVVMRVYVTPVGGSFGTGTILFDYNTNVGLNGDSWISFTETIASRPDVTRLFLRRTNVNAIGNFLDALDAKGGSAFTTAVVNTAAGGTLIQWTRTAGGTVFELISGRVRGPGFTWDANTIALIANNPLLFGIYVKTSNNLSNAALQLKIYRRRNGTDLLVYTGPTGTKLTTTSVAQATQGGTLAQQTDFLEDDRVVIRPYLTNSGTMAGGFTATIEYDGNVDAAGNGNSAVGLNEASDFKAETEPDKQPPSQSLMGGTGA